MACAGVIAFAIAYLVVDLAQLPRLFYLPLERRFVLASHVSTLAIGYFGLWLWAGAAAAIAVTAAGWLAPRRPRSRAARAAGLLSAIACTLAAAVTFSVRG